MLVLTRRPGEGVVIEMPDGTRGMVTVERANRSRGSAKLCFAFPENVRIYRTELVDDSDPSKTISRKLADLLDSMRTLLALIQSFDVEVTNPTAMRAVAEARALIGVLDGKKTATEDRLDLEENTRKDSHRWSDHT